MNSAKAAPVHNRRAKLARLRPDARWPLVIASALLVGACQQQAPLLTVGQPHTILVERDGDSAPTVQVAIPVLAPGATSVSLQRGGVTVETVSNQSEASPSAWLPGGIDLWDSGAPYGPSLDYQVVAKSGGASVTRNVPVTIVRTLFAYPRITSPLDGSAGVGSEPTILWTPVGLPQANPADGYRLDAWYVDYPTQPEMSFFLGPDEDSFDWGRPATSSTGQTVTPPPLSSGDRVEIQVIAIASSSTQTEETLSQAITVTP